MVKAALHQHTQAEQAMQERLQQQQADLQALHHGLEDSNRQHQEQQSCLQQTQVCALHSLPFEDNTGLKWLATVDCSSMYLAGPAEPV